MAADAGSLKALLRDHGLRATTGRVEVYQCLAAAGAPMSHREAAEALPSMDRVTVFRNLVALVEAGLAVRVDVGDHTWRYALATGHGGDHVADHPHFTCTACGDVQCLDDIEIRAGDGVAALLQGAEVTVRGVCAECR